MVRKEKLIEIKKDPIKLRKHREGSKRYKEKLKKDPIRYKHFLEMHKKHEKNRRLRNIEKERELARKRYYYMSKEKKQKIFEQNKLKRILNRKNLIKQWGNKCQKCGYSEHPEILQFDHIVPLYRGTNRIKKIVGDKMIKEVKEHPERFDLLCPNCHILKTHKEVQELLLLKKPDEQM